MKKIIGIIKKNKNIVFIIFFIIILVLFINLLKNYSGNKKNEYWINLSEFSSPLEMEKEGKILSYPEIDILSEVDGEVVSLNVEIGDIIDEWQPLIQIDDGMDGDIDVEAQISKMFSNYYDIRDRYEEFNSKYSEEIKKLENEIIEKSTALGIAIDMDNKQWIKDLEKEIGEINEKLTTLQSESNSLESQLYDLDEKIQVANAESIKFYYEMEKKSPTSLIPGIVGNIYVQIGDEVNIGDKLITIINNSETPEISLNMTFQEYIMTKDLKQVMIMVENENWGDFYYEGEIYTRSPILNEEGKYTITVKILDEVFDLILSDNNTKITVLFYIDSLGQRIPDNCFKYISNSSGILTLRDGDIIKEKEVLINSKWKGWNNVKDLGLYSLENEEKKHGIRMCIKKNIEIMCKSI